MVVPAIRTFAGRARSWLSLMDSRKAGSCVTLVPNDVLNKNCPKFRGFAFISRFSTVVLSRFLRQVDLIIFPLTSVPLVGFWKLLPTYGGCVATRASCTLTGDNNEVVEVHRCSCALLFCCCILLYESGFKFSCKDFFFCRVDWYAVLFASTMVLG